MTGSASGRGRYSGRDVGGAFVMLIGVAVIGSGLVFNPVVARLWQGVYAIDKADVLLSYCLWALVLGAAIIWTGAAFASAAPGGRADRALILVLPLSLLFLGDRFLLVEMGLPLWTHDTELHYRHRPNITRTLARAGRPNDVISINRHGHHDTDYPVEKPPGEFRALMIGDSITMGDQLPYEATFSAQLEALLAERAGVPLDEVPSDFSPRSPKSPKSPKSPRAAKSPNAPTATSPLRSPKGPRSPRSPRSPPKRRKRPPPAQHRTYSSATSPLPPRAPRAAPQTGSLIAQLANELLLYDDACTQGRNPTT